VTYQSGLRAYDDERRFPPRVWKAVELTRSRGYPLSCTPDVGRLLQLCAGLRGIEKGYVLGPQAEDNVWSLTPEERRSMGYKELPTSLGVALTEMENSELVAEALGEHVFDFFLRNKRTEWENYRSHVTPFELKTYLSL